MNRPDRSIRDLTALAAVARIRSGLLASEELTAACLDGAQCTDTAPGRWAWIDCNQALDRAREMDSLRQHGLPLGALHGVPVSIEDGFAGSGGQVEGAEHVRPTPCAPDAPAPAIVERLLEAGAIVIGATRVADPDLGQSAPSLHPRDERRTAGAPCGNAAAAVSACQVPLAVTCEAQGGIIRAASYCDVFGFRPARGVISRRGAASLSPTTDQVGILGRTLEDVAVLADVLGGYDAADTASYLRPRPRMQEGAASTPPVAPDFIWLDMPYNDRLSAAGRAGFEELLEFLGPRAVRFPAPAWFGRLPAAHRIIFEYETAAAWRMKGEPSESTLFEVAQRGAAHGEERYHAALDAMEQGQKYFAELFNDYDAVITPARRDRLLYSTHRRTTIPYSAWHGPFADCPHYAYPCWKASRECRSASS